MTWPIVWVWTLYFLDNNTNWYKSSSFKLITIKLGHSPNNSSSSRNLCSINNFAPKLSSEGITHFERATARPPSETSCADRITLFSIKSIHKLWTSNSVLELNIGSGPSILSYIFFRYVDPPSEGEIFPNADPTHIAKGYESAGAAAISVLTDQSFFGGSLDILNSVRNAVSIPVIRKDFIIDEYQIYESRKHGADSLLLMVSALEPLDLKRLIELCNKLWIQPLVETHNKEELQIALDSGADIIGINHRNLHDFSMEINLVEKLMPIIPNGKIVVAESGINSYEDVKRMKSLGVNAVLVGESIMRAENIDLKIKELMGI